MAILSIVITGLITLNHTQQEIIGSLGGKDPITLLVIMSTPLAGTTCILYKTIWPPTHSPLPTHTPHCGEFGPPNDCGCVEI